MKLIQYTRPGGIWPTFGRLGNLQNELDRLFDAAPRTWAPALEVHENKEGYTVHVELPGVKREEIEVAVENGTLIISGERKIEAKSEGSEVHCQERYFGKFSRALTLPTAVANDKVKASYKDGVLTVVVPKAEEAKPRQITISE